MKKNGTIVLIDDNLMELKLTEIAMNKAAQNKKIVSFSDSEIAFDYIMKNTDDIFIIISDLEMPGMTGLDILKKLNADHGVKMRSVPFIFLSNSGLSEDIENAYLMAAQGYFQKPYQLGRLTDIFSNIINYWNYAEIPENGTKN